MGQEKKEIGKKGGKVRGREPKTGQTSLILSSKLEKNSEHKDI